MGVLDTFVFLLETDNKNALKGLNDTDHALDDVQDGSKNAHKELMNIFAGVGEKAGITTESLKGLAIAAIGIAGAGLSLNAVLDRTTEMLGKVHAAETVGVNVGQYDALSRTFQTLGVDADGFRDSMIDLNEAMGEAASDAKSGKAESFKTFGISLKDSQGNIKSADEALLELSDTMSKMDKQQATFQIKQLGITDNAVIAAMMNGRKELERRIELQKTLGILNEKDAAQLKNFKSAQDDLSAIFSRFADVLAMTVVPALELLIDVTISVIKWAREHKGVLMGVFGALAFVAIPALTTALWGMARAALAAVIPFLPLIAVAVALALVIDDLWNYFTGGESVIGDLAAKFPLLKSALDDAKESVIGAWEALKLLFSDPSQFMDVLVAELRASWDEIVQGVVDAGDAIGKALNSAWEQLTADTKKVFTDLLSWVKSIFSQIGAYISDAISNAGKAAYDKLPDFMKKAINAVKGEDEPKPVQPTPGGAADEVNPIKQLMPSVQAANSSMQDIANAPAIPANPATVAGAGGKGNVTATQKIDNITIQTGSGDPQQIRTAVSDGMNDHVQQLTNQYDDGRSH
ncbi:phage tail tape measure protein [Citrobacter freundii]|uniref:Uncharacterized protein n=1 Tax=uncultured Citrobacter sp. TaxID=200446 RepID=A0A212I9A5_9ENTR|nr:hypothetical protein [Citrobacter freundii]MBJ9533534.1 hypothetical protein [Citrobacter freundii]QLZ07108.1 hypothetical protein HV103_10175 [Citrobacter freundii]SBV63344.1 membrane hypothetical protein [uncultured Citrobacter sp.]SBV68272.1 membrane hypothetical protein [uncultured Citrobacter sp.]